MSVFIDNWYLFIGLLAIIIFIICFVYRFFKMPTSKQIDVLKEWLKYAVMQAEKELGSGTGQAKLRFVYDMAISKFKWLSFVSFESFSTWVDEALEWLNAQLESNENINKYVRN